MTTMTVIPSCAQSAQFEPEATYPTVRLLPDEHIDERLRHLKDACRLLADGFDRLDEQIAAYVSATPGQRNQYHDVDGFLAWLERVADLDDEQRNLIAALSGTCAVELVAVRQRLAHARFQELASVTRRLIRELETNPGLTIHLNPIHVWSQFESRALVEFDEDVPAKVLFVPVRSDVRAVVIEDETEALLRDLERNGPTTTGALFRRTRHGERSRVLERIRNLARLGVIAFG